MLIEVTARDIELGDRGAYSLCPVSRAIRRQQGSKCSIESSDAVWLSDNQLAWLPQEESERIVHYDRTGVMHPHSFTLDMDR